MPDRAGPQPLEWDGLANRNLGRCPRLALDGPSARTSERRAPQSDLGATLNDYLGSLICRAILRGRPGPSKTIPV
jgi:hypothetical protein